MKRICISQCRKSRSWSTAICIWFISPPSLYQRNFMEISLYLSEDEGERGSSLRFEVSVTKEESQYVFPIPSRMIIFAVFSNSM